MMKVMGFCGFDTTKGKKVDGNNAGEVHVILKRKYRQVFKNLIKCLNEIKFICKLMLYNRTSLFTDNI